MNVSSRRSEPLAPVPMEAPEHRPTALIADDQEAFRRAARQLLTEAGFDVVAVAVDGDDALGLASIHAPAFVMLDIWMPGLDGIAAARIIRERQPEAVVVLITARELDDLPSRATDADAQAIISKADLTPQMVHSIWEASRRPA